MEYSTLAKAGLTADAGAARPRSGQPALDVCPWNAGVNASKQVSPMFTDITTNLIRRLQESSQ